MMKATELRNKSISELQTLLNDLGREKMNLLFQKSLESFSKPHLLRQVKRNIARVKTILSESMQRQQQVNSSSKLKGVNDGQ